MWELVYQRNFWYLGNLYPDETLIKFKSQLHNYLINIILKDHYRKMIEIFCECQTKAI